MSRKFLYIPLFLLLLSVNISCGRKTAPEAPEFRAPKVVTEFQLKGLRKGILLSWQAPTQNLKDDDLIALEGFAIMRREYELAGNDDFEFLANVRPNSKSNSYTYIDTNAISGKTYDYTVAAINNDGVEGQIEIIGRVNFQGEDSKVTITPYVIEEK